MRAKFRCTSYTTWSDKPTETFGSEQWPRKFVFHAVYDYTVPEDQRYAMATPAGEITLHVDNPAATFTPGRSYYVDFTELEEATA